MKENIGGSKDEKANSIKLCGIMYSIDGNCISKLFTEHIGVN